MLSTYSSYVRRQPEWWWRLVVCLLGVWYCEIACCQAPSELPTIEPQKSTIKLEAPVEVACVGGRGRYLIASLRDRREVVVVDLVKRFVSFTIPLGEDEVELAAGATQLHIVAPDSSLFQTWDLRTGHRLRETAWPLEGHVKTIAMGSGNDRRLAVCYADSPYQEEPSQWATIELPSMEVQRLKIAGVLGDNEFQLHASTDGNVFVAWAPQSLPQNRGVVLIKQSYAEWLDWPKVPSDILLNESGSHLFTEKGVFGHNLTENQFVGMEEVAACVPAATGPMFLTHDLHDGADVWTLRSLDRHSAMATTLKLGQPLLFSVEAGYIATLINETEIALYRIDVGELPASD